MNIKSLGYRTDFLFNTFDGSVEDKGQYFVAKTHSNPNYFWGNLLLFKSPPKEGDLAEWKRIFKEEFSGSDIHHITFGWDSPSGERGEVKEFENDGFGFETSVVLTATKVIKPPKYNQNIKVYSIDTEADFERSIEIQVSRGEDHLSKESWEDFYKKAIAGYRKMIEAEKGIWFGAKIDGVLVGCLGVFTDGDVGRYQIVCTDSNFQRKGVCSTLVYESAKYAFDTMGVAKLVMVADEEYHAAKIYESVGFQPTEKQVGVCWWDEKVHS